MENISSEVYDTLAKGSWESRLKEARAQREAILRTRSAKAVDECISSEVYDTLAKGSWENRLKEARAQGDDILRERSAEAVDWGRPSTDQQLTSSAVVAKMLRYGSNRDPQPPKEEPLVAARAIPNRLAKIGLGSGIGIGVAAAVLLLQIQFPNREPLAIEQEPVAAPLPGSAPKIVAARPKPAAQTVAVSETSLPPLERPVDLAELEVRIVPPVPLSPPYVPKMSGTAAGESLEFAALSALELNAIPDDGLPLRPATPVTAAPGHADVTVLVNAAASLFGLDLDARVADVSGIQLVAANGSFRAAAGTGSHLPEALSLPALIGPETVYSRDLIADPARPEFLASLTIVLPAVALNADAGIALASIGDDLFAHSGSDKLTQPPAPGEVPAADMSPPKPAIPTAADMALWVFAAATVDKDTVDTTLSTVEGFDMHVTAVNRVNYRITKNQVRYYDAPSAAMANRLAAEIGAVPRDFTRSDVNPPPGTLEIYLAGEAAKTLMPRSVAKAIAPSRRQQPSQANRLRNSVISKLRAGWSK